LALWQTNWVIERLCEIYPQYEFKIRTFDTQGDQVLDVALSKIGDKGLFTRELEQALLEEEIDCAVHSLKDMPSVMPEGLYLGAIGKREHPGDVLVSRGVAFRDLPQGARIGTSALRRSAQLLCARPDLKVFPLRGNVQTRLRKLDQEGYDGIVLAAAGVIRLNLQHHITEFLPTEMCLPAVGQGAIAVQCREADTSVLCVLEGIDDEPTRVATTAERSLMQELGGGCQVPLAALAEWREGVLSMEALVASLEGTRVLRAGRTLAQQSGCDIRAAHALGVRVAQDLRGQGAEEILADLRP